MSAKPDYLGDGVYAIYNEFGDGQLVLRTGSHEGRNADAEIFLEPEVMAALERYMQRIKKAVSPPEAADHGKQS